MFKLQVDIRRGLHLMELRVVRINKIVWFKPRSKCQNNLRVVREGIVERRHDGAIYGVLDAILDIDNVWISSWVVITRSYTRIYRENKIAQVGGYCFLKRGLEDGVASRDDIFSKIVVFEQGYKEKQIVS